jgi:hypothetical protein
MALSFAFFVASLATKAALLYRVRATGISTIVIHPNGERILFNDRP